VKIVSAGSHLYWDFFLMTSSIFGGRRQSGAVLVYQAVGLRELMFVIGLQFFVIAVGVLHE
jgi:hypothetical protein